MPKMKTNFAGLVNLLAKNLYPEPDVFIRELIQNAHDSIQLRKIKEPHLHGKIDIIASAPECTISFEDNGQGMDKSDIENFLSTIGRSGTGEQSQKLRDEDFSVETIGQFGIGLLSAFVIAEQIDVYTCKYVSTQGWHWSNCGGDTYSLTACEWPQEGPGSRVVVKVKEHETTHIKEATVRDTIKKYADFIPFNILLNGNGPVNVVNAPWHLPNQTDAEREHALELFIKERYDSTPLHIIPVNTVSPRAMGVLYIPDHHVLSSDANGVVDIFQERMAIRMKDQDLLPAWAKFIVGVIDSPDLSPTAARDNIRKNEAYYNLRNVLGGLITQSIMQLSHKDQRKFFRICNWHHYHLKGMAVHHQEFFNAVIEYLPFETNKGELTLKEIVGQQPSKVGEKVPIYFFSFGYDSNQFYELCEAKNLIAINTGKAHDEPLLRKYVKLYPNKLELMQMDHLDDEQLFAKLDDEEHQKYYLLEFAILRALENAGIQIVRPTMRKFEPASMSAAIISTQKLESFDAMRAILNNPIIQGLGDWAQQISEDLKQKPMDLFLNANNELIQHLAQLEKPADRKHESILVGVFNSAILYSQHQLTLENAKIFYQHFQNQMLNSLKLETELNHLRKEKADLQFREVERSRQEKEAQPDRDWIQLFVAMSYDQEYEPVFTALKNILQRPPYYFELKQAQQSQEEQTLRDNIIAHVLNADGFVVDISSDSKDVLMELGWIYYGPQFEQKPKLVLKSEQQQREIKDLVDFWVVKYSSPGSETLQEELAKEIEKHQKLNHLKDAVRQKQKKRFLSPELFHDMRHFPADSKALFKAYKTVEDLLSDTKEEFQRKLSEQGDDQLGTFYDPVFNYLNLL